MSDLPRTMAFLFGGTGTGEIALIFVIILLLFGPRKLPEIARTIGKVLSQLRNASNDFRDQIMRIDDDDKPSAPVMDVEAKDVDAKEVNADESDGEGDSVDDDEPAG